jgi:hypothetical protein
MNRTTIEITWESDPGQIADEDVRRMIEAAMDQLMERLAVYAIDPAVFATLNAPDAMADGER